MEKSSQSSAFSWPSLPAYLLLALLGVLWVAGGASRADVTGQAVVRFASCLLLSIAVLARVKPSLSVGRPVFVLLLASLALVLLQLVPLPSAIWQTLPGRAPVDPTAMLKLSPWRPIAIVPDGAVNAAFSLIIPFAVLLLASSLNIREQRWLPATMLCLVIASMLMGLLQFSGAGVGNPFINDSASMSGNFANRNHFATFLALGCLVAPVWAFLDGRRPGWRAPAAFGLVLVFLLGILASGSRAGLGLGFLATALGLWVVRPRIKRALRNRPKWVFGVLVLVLAAIVATIALASVNAGRAISIDRIVALDTADDMRSFSLPTVLLMIRTYFPFGSGFGSFDQVFRIHEPFDLLSLRYLNHVHNDFLEVLLDGGIAGAALIAAALAWWAFASWRAWRLGDDVAKLGSAALLLVLLASLVDYPARTPMMMAVVILSALWLDRARRGLRSALPSDG